MDQMVNYICLAWKLVCMLSTYRTCNSMIKFLKYEFNNLLGDVTLLSVTQSITWTLLIYIYIYMSWDQITPSVTYIYIYIYMSWDQITLYFFN